MHVVAPLSTNNETQNFLHLVKHASEGNESQNDQGVLFRERINSVPSLKITLYSSISGNIPSSVSKCPYLVCI